MMQTIYIQWRKSWNSLNKIKESKYISTKVTNSKSCKISRPTATRQSALTRGGIIWDDGRVQAFRKRGSAVIQSVLRNPGSSGYVGTDRIEEDGYRLYSESRGPVSNDAGQILRFALIARSDSAARNKLRANEPLAIVTSYPRIAFRQLEGTQLASLDYVNGCIEAELIDRPDIDAAFELVQSGDSVRQNGLQIVEDDIQNVYLNKVSAPVYDPDSLMLAIKEEKCEND